MKCVAVYDMFIPEHCFVDAIKDSGLFDEFETYGWKQDQDRAEARNTIRQMETKGSRAFELDPELIAAMQDADVPCSMPPRTTQWALRRCASAS